MANDWIKMRSGLWDHPKVVRIVSAICPQSVRDLSMRCRVLGALYRTWALADQYTDDGILDGYTEEYLDEAVGIEGWSKNLAHVGWLIIEPQRLILPEFGNHNGVSAKRRSEDALRKKKSRSNQNERPQSVHKMSAKSVTREEKRREDNKYPLPLLFSDTPVEQLWRDFIRHRSEKKSSLTPTAAARVIRKLESWGVERSAAALEHSIANGYSGVFEPNGSAPKPAATQKRMSDLTPDEIAAMGREWRA